MININDLFISEIKINKGNVDESVYPFTIPAMKFIDKLKLSSNVTFFAGENGIGKSTLIEAIAVNYGFNAEGGSKNFHFSTRRSHSDLYKSLTLVKGIRKPADGYFLRAESFYNVATNIDKMDSEPSFDRPVNQAYGGISLHDQSHGESFMSVIINRLFGNGLYIFDEPEAALSPIRQMTLLARMNQLVNTGSQFIIATHSPILMAYPNAEIYELSENGVNLTPYKDTESYKITKQFLDDPERMLKYLFD